MDHNQRPDGSPSPYNYGSGYAPPHWQNAHQQMYGHRSHHPMQAHASPVLTPPTFTPLMMAWPASTPPPPLPPPPPPPPPSPLPSYLPMHANSMPTYGPNHHQPAYGPGHYTHGPQRAYEVTYSTTIHHYGPFPPQPTSQYTGPAKYGPDSFTTNTSRINTPPSTPQPPTPTPLYHPQVQPSLGVAHVPPQSICIPPEAFIAPHEEALLLMVAQDREDIPRLPSNRSRIWHAVCGKMHAPEECRGPLTKGTLGGCALCGRSEHITDDCGYWLLMPQNERASLKRYFYLFSRQALPPLASRKDFTAQEMDGLRPPLCPITATHYEHEQNQLDRQAGHYRPYYARFNYNALSDTHMELARLPEEDPCLGKWKNAGPLPNCLAHWAKSEYLGREHAVPYDPSWTLFSNKHVRSYRERVVKFPNWVTHVESLVELDSDELPKNGGKHRRDESPPQQSSTPAPKKRKLTPISTEEDEEGEQPYDAPEKLLKTGDHPADIAKDSSEAKEDPHVADREQIYLHEEHDIDSLAKLSPDEARKIETEDERDKSPLPQSPACASHRRTFSITHSDAEEHEETEDQQDCRPEKLLKAEDKVADTLENDPSALPPDVDDLEHADHDDQHNITTELEFWRPDSPEFGSDEETTGYDFDYDPASLDWSGPEQETGPASDYDPGSPDWENDQ